MIQIKRIKKLILILIILCIIVSSWYCVIAYNESSSNLYIIGDNSQIPGFPNRGGDVYNLAILIRFQDQEPISEEKIKKIDTIYNADIGWSLKTFYNAYTYRMGSCKTFIGPYDNGIICEYVDSMPRSYYTYNEYKVENEDGSEDKDYTNLNMSYLQLELYTNAIKYAAEHLPPGININDLDKNNDGEIDNITFIIDGEEENWGEVLWPSQFSISDTLIDNVQYYTECIKYSENYEAWQQYIEQYLTENPELVIENKIVDKCNAVFLDDLTASTSIHEFMHVFGYIDNYHYPEKENEPLQQRTLRI